MHVKDSGTVLLTKHDLTEHAYGRVSDRVKSTWGLTYEEMVEVIKNNNYRIITKDDTEFRESEETSGEVASSSEESCNVVSGTDGPKD